MKQEECTAKLFFPEEEPQGDAGEVEIFAQFVLQIIFVWLFDVVGIITEETKAGNLRRQLGHVFYLQRMASYYGRVIRSPGRQHHFVKLRRRYFPLTVLVYFQCGFDGPEDAGLFRDGDKEDRQIG